MKAMCIAQIKTLLTALPPAGLGIRSKQITDRPEFERALKANNKEQLILPKVLTPPFAVLDCSQPEMFTFNGSLHARKVVQSDARHFLRTWRRKNDVKWTLGLLLAGSKRARIQKPSVRSIDILEADMKRLLPAHIQWTEATLGESSVYFEAVTQMNKVTETDIGLTKDDIRLVDLRIEFTYGAYEITDKPVGQTLVRPSH